MLFEINYLQKDYTDIKSIHLFAD